MTAARGAGAESRGAGLHERILVTVEGFPALLALVDNDCRGIQLFLDGIPMAKMPPESCQPDPADPGVGFLRFRLDRNDDNDRAWHSLLGGPEGFSRRIIVSVGPNGGVPIATKVRDFRLEIASPPIVYLFFAVLVAVVVIFAWRSRKSALLRDVGPDGKLGAYNLARVQLAFWSLVVVSAFSFIWLITGELDSLNASVVALLGIGAGTALGAALVEGNPATRTDASDSSAPLPRSSAGLVRDLVSDDRGTSLYYFQLAVWTVVLGIIFVIEVYRTLAMPELNSALLALLGISSGTFVGAKAPR